MFVVSFWAEHECRDNTSLLLKSFGEFFFQIFQLRNWMKSVKGCVSLWQIWWTWESFADFLLFFRKQRNGTLAPFGKKKSDFPQAPFCRIITASFADTELLSFSFKQWLALLVFGGFSFEWWTGFALAKEKKKKWRMSFWGRKLYGLEQRYTFYPRKKFPKIQEKTILQPLYCIRCKNRHDCLSSALLFVKEFFWHFIVFDLFLCVI